MAAVRPFCHGDRVDYVGCPRGSAGELLSVWYKGEEEYWWMIGVSGIPITMKKEYLRHEVTELPPDDFEFPEWEEEDDVD